MDKRRVSKTVGRRELRGLGDWLLGCCCWFEFELGGGEVVCLGVLPLRLMGAD